MRGVVRGSGTERDLLVWRHKVMRTITSRHTLKVPFKIWGLNGFVCLFMYLPFTGLPPSRSRRVGTVTATLGFAALQMVVEAFEGQPGRQQ